MVGLYIGHIGHGTGREGVVGEARKQVEEAGAVGEEGGGFRSRSGAVPGPFRRRDSPYCIWNVFYGTFRMERENV